MPKITLVAGLVYILFGVISYLTFGQSSITSLIPAFFGIPVAALGYAAMKNEKLRKHFMHAAVVIMLLCLVFPLVRAVPKLSQGIMNNAIAAQLVMAVIALAYLIPAVKSFIDARRSK